MTKLCIDCKHARPSEHVGADRKWEFAKCTHDPQDLVAGAAVLADAEYCSIHRRAGWFDVRVIFRTFCGKEGRFWEAK